MIPLVQKLSDLVNSLKSYFVQKSGDTMTGGLTTTTHGGSWISQASANTPFVITPSIVTNEGRYDGIMRGTFADGSSWVLGGIRKAIWMTYYASGQTYNSPSGSIIFDFPNSSIESDYFKTRHNGYFRANRNDYSGAANPSNSMWMNAVAGYDSDNIDRLVLRQVAHPDGYQGVQLEAKRVINGASHYNSLRMEIDGSGNQRVVLNSDLWRAAINAVNKSGDTMQGALNFANATWNVVGDDSAIGDINYGNTLGIKGMSGTAAIMIRNSSNADQYYVLFTGTDSSQRINDIRAFDYLHVGTYNRGNFGVTWWSSDERMKKDIEDSVVDALSAVNKIRHRAFTMKTDGEHHDIGYISQELAEIDPKFVLEVPNTRQGAGGEVFTGDYRYQVDERKLIPYLSKAIQQLSAKNDELEARIVELERRLGE